MADGNGLIVLLAGDQQEESEKAVHQLEEFIFHGIFFFGVINTTAYASLSSSLPCILGIFSADLLVSLVHMGV